LSLVDSHTMERMSITINRTAEIALLVIISVMACVVFVEVLFRYALMLPLFWTEEFARYCLVWSSLLGASVALKRGEHIAVTFFVHRLPRGVAPQAALIVSASIVLFLAVIFWGGIHLVILTRHQLSPAMRIPMSWPYLAIPISSFIMLLHELVFMLERLRSMIPTRGSGNKSAER
jgi:TRAP-type C4-dicarboxylate transport system permease small subunit